MVGTGGAPRCRRPVRLSLFFSFWEGASSPTLSVGRRRCWWCVFVCVLGAARRAEVSRHDGHGLQAVRAVDGDARIIIAFAHGARLEAVTARAHPERVRVVLLVRVPALFQPQGKVRPRPGPSGGGLSVAAPYKVHGGNSTTRSLHAWNECTKREYAKDVRLGRHLLHQSACKDRVFERM